VYFALMAIGAMLGLLTLVIGYFSPPRPVAKEHRTTVP
jgi:hypothetical protein